MYMTIAVIDPFHVCGNAAKLEDKTKEIFASVKKNLIVLYSSLAAFPQTCKGSIQYAAFRISFVRNTSEDAKPKVCTCPWSKNCVYATPLLYVFTGCIATGDFRQ